MSHKAFTSQETFESIYEVKYFRLKICRPKQILEFESRISVVFFHVMFYELLARYLRIILEVNIQVYVT